MRQNKKGLLLISKGNAMFIRNDKNELAKYFNISSFVYPNVKGLANVAYLIKLFIYCLYELPFNSYLYVWFADYHSVIPIGIARLLGKRSIIIIGGYDAANIPEFHYGAHRNRIRSWFIEYSCKAAQKVITVSKFVDNQLKENIESDISTEVVYNAVPTTNEIEVNITEAKKFICTVVAGSDHYRYKIKGIDIFLSVASSLPNIPFLIIGPRGELFEKINRECSDNVKVLSSIEHKDFIKELSKVRIICQFSRYESFGVSVIEAMALGALPVTTDHTGTSEIVPEGEQYRVNIHDDIAEIVSKVRRNYYSDINSDKYRKHVKNNFQMSDRIEKILNIIEGE